MKFKEVLILLPCHSLEDFPLHYEGPEAEGLLAAWSCMWHPAFIAATGNMPTWARADDPPQDLADKLIVVPQVSESMLLAGWPARAKNEGACVLRKLTTREQLVAAGLEALDPPTADGEPATLAPADLDPELVADFHALGYAYLEEELLTRQMRYMSNLDEVHFGSETAKAAQAVVQGDAVEAKARLQSCFDILAEARDRFYPAEAYLVDLTLVAGTTLGPALKAELQSGRPLNLIISGEVLEQMAAEQPQTLAALQSALAAEQVSLVGGERSERELPLIPMEAILDEFRQGLASYQRLLGQRPHVYGRRRFGITPLLPQVLVRFGFGSALHLAFDDGAFPRGEQSKTRWEGLGDSSVDTLTRVPLEADKSSPFLNYCERMGNVMDLDYVATLTFARWPGQGCPWYEDIRRIGKYSPVLGRFVTLKNYFATTENPGHSAKYTADQYRSPYLRQAIIRRHPNPISRVVDEHRRRLQWEATAAVHTLASTLKLQVQGEDSPQQLEAIRAAAIAGAPQPDLDRELASRNQAAQQAFAQAMPRAAGADRPGYLLVNPFSFPRRVGLSLPELKSLPAIDGPIKATQAEGNRVVVDVPALGYTWIDANEATAPSPPRGKPKKEVPLGDAKEMLLRNEFFEVIVNVKSGGIQSLRDYKQRGSRLSQQLAYRVPGARPKVGDAWQDPDDVAVYSQMVADSVELTTVGPAMAEIVSRGSLVDRQGARLAGFRQSVQVWRSLPVIGIEVELDVVEEPRADPWNSYYASRFGWSDESATMYRGVGFARQKTDSTRLESPHYVELKADPQSLAFLTGGLPYHRRVGLGVLDTMLVCRGESQRAFRLGIAVDVPHALPYALDLIRPIVPISEGAGQPQGPPTSWLFHLDRKNVVATHWEPLLEGGRVVGFRARLMETAGSSVRCKLRSFRAAKTARQVDFQGETLVQLPVEDDAVIIDFTSYEWVELEARF